MNTDLDMTIDAYSWVKEHPVYCPVPWCNAHKMRDRRCGDVDGDYIGIHVARLRYVRTWNKGIARKMQLYRELGLRNPEMIVGHDIMIQDAIDAGLLKGRRGRRP